MKKYTIFHPLWMAFYSKALYRDVARNWKGICLGYLVFVLGLSWIFPLIKINRIYTNFLHTTVQDIIRQIPPMTVERGEMSTPELRPYVITEPRSGITLATIDATGKVTSLDDAKRGVLITKTKIIVKRSVGETRVYELAKVNHLVVDQDRAQDWVRTFNRWFSVLFYPTLILASLVYRLAQALLYAFIGLILAKWLEVPLEYPALIRLATLSITPVLVLDAIRDILGKPVPFWPWICFLIAMGYLIYGVNVNGDVVGDPLNN